MKNVYLCVILYLLITTTTIAQVPLSVNLGADTLLCLNNNKVPSDTIIIGNTKTVCGGKLPYSYAWKLFSKSSNKESDIFLPYEIATNKSYLYFTTDMNFTYPDTSGEYILKLTVTDANNSIASDSLNIRISINRIGDLMLIPTFDSVQISPLIEGGIRPFSFLWSPSTGLSNPHIQGPKAKKIYPNISYSLEITDSYGCNFFTPNFVLITDIKNGDLQTGFVSYKNPVSNSGSMNFTTELLGSKLQIVSAGGIIQYQTKVENESIPLGSLISTTGIYYFTLTTPIGKILSGSFIRE